MACPMRVYLAGFSALVALFIVWRAGSREDDDEDKHRLAKVAKDKTWYHLLLDFFTGKYLWDVYQSSRQEEEPPSSVAAAAALAARPKAA